MSKATDQQWRVQVRKSRAHKWVNKGLFETRNSAREQCSMLRGDYWGGCYAEGSDSRPCYGFGNTRVISYVKAKKGHGK